MTTHSHKPLPQARLRTLARQRRRQVDPTYRQQAQTLIATSLLKLDCIRRAQRIAVYLAAGSELELTPFMQMAAKRGKQLFVPRLRGAHMDFIRWHNGDALSLNRFGIAEPALIHVQKPQFLDVVITPLVAFDDSARRIGQGGGYYDRTFSWLKQRRFWRKPTLIGAAFDCQRVDHITPNSWDISLQAIITEAAVYPEAACTTG